MPDLDIATGARDAVKPDRRCLRRRVESANRVWAGYAAASSSSARDREDGFEQRLANTEQQLARLTKDLGESANDSNQAE